MIKTKKKEKWFKVSDILSYRNILGGINPNNLMILQNIWEKEFKGINEYCELYGIEKNKIILKTKNSVIANEINIRKDSILKDLNKHFRTKWIKDIKII